MITNYAKLNAICNALPLTVNAKSIRFKSENLIEIINEIKETVFNIDQFLTDRFPKLNGISEDAFIAHSLAYEYESGLDTIVRLDSSFTSVSIAESDDELFESYSEALDAYFEKTYETLKTSLDTYVDARCDKQVERVNQLNWFTSILLKLKRNPDADDDVILNTLSKPASEREQMIRLFFASAKADIITDYNNAKLLIEECILGD